MLASGCACKFLCEATLCRSRIHRTLRKGSKNSFKLRACFALCKATLRKHRNCVRRVALHLLLCTSLACLGMNSHAIPTLACEPIRKERDSNPWYNKLYADLANQCLRPLSHPSPLKLFTWVLPDSFAIFARVASHEFGTCKETRAKQAPRVNFYANWVNSHAWLRLVRSKAREFLCLACEAILTRPWCFLGTQFRKGCAKQARAKGREASKFRVQIKPCGIALHTCENSNPEFA